jgi:D-aspartate ligase
MIHETISAPGSEDCIVHEYCDRQSKPVVLFTGIKLRSYPVCAGPTTLARSRWNDALQRQATEIFSAIGYRGIMDMDFRLDGFTGRFNLLDFNPRVGAQFRLFRTDNGTMSCALFTSISPTGRPAVENQSKDEPSCRISRTLLLVSLATDAAL